MRALELPKEKKVTNFKKKTSDAPKERDSWVSDLPSSSKGRKGGVLQWKKEGGKSRKSSLRAACLVGVRQSENRPGLD